LGGPVGWCIKEGSSVQYSIQCSDIATSDHGDIIQQL